MLCAHTSVSSALFCVAHHVHPDAATFLSRKKTTRRRPKRLLHEIYITREEGAKRLVQSRLSLRETSSSSSSSPLKKGFATGFTEHDHHPVKSSFIGSCCSSAKRRRRRRIRRPRPLKTRAVFRRRETTSRETTTQQQQQQQQQLCDEDDDDDGKDFGDDE